MTHLLKHCLLDIKTAAAWVPKSIKLIPCVLYNNYTDAVSNLRHHSFMMENNADNEYIHAVIHSLC